MKRISPKLAITVFFLCFIISISTAQTPFVTTWETTTCNETITIPTGGLVYDYEVDWSYDGVTFNAESTNVTGDATNTYASSGIHTIAIMGTFPSIRFNNLGDKLKILTIEQWGDQAWTSFDSAFYGCSNLELNATDTPNLSNTTNLQFMFRGCLTLGQNNAANWNWNVVTIESMDSMFYLARNFNQNIGAWDVSNVRGFSNFLRTALNFNQDISNWDTGSATNMEYMFGLASSFNQNISGWDVKNVTIMTNMFRRSANFDQNLGNWDISKVTDMGGMLLEAGLSVTNYDTTLIGWNTLDAGETQIPQNVNFNGGNSKFCAAKLNRTDLEDTYLWTIADGGESFECLVPSDYFITTWEITTANETITIPTFSGETYNYEVDWSYDDVTFNAESTAITGDAVSGNLPIGTYTIAIRGTFPRVYFNNSGDAAKIQTITQWGTTEWTSMENAFWACTNLINKAADTPDLSNVTAMDNMFRECKYIGFVNTDTGNWNWNTSNIDVMNGAFYNADRFNGDISGWDVSNVSQMHGMFAFSQNFNVDITQWNVSNAWRLSDMFWGAINFNQNISGWDVSSATTTKFQFRNAQAFNQNLGDWDISNISNMTDMFLNATLSTTNYDATLIGWHTLDAGETQIPQNITFSGGNSMYCDAGFFRDDLETMHGWTITDANLDPTCGILVSPKVYLQGAALNPNTGEEMVMRDIIRLAGLIPTTSPYADNLTCDISVLTVTGNDAIVDWVWVELRDENTHTMIVDSQSALLQRDGDVVNIDGTSAVAFNKFSGNYYLVIKHRNHLGIMSNTSIVLSNMTTTVDFTNSASQITYGSNAQTTFGMPPGIIGMWCGNANGDTVVQYSGTNPDAPDILSTVLNDAGNFLNFPTYVVTEYNTNDVNMDGNTQYSGTNPDTPFILQNILAHPGNFLNFSTYQIIEQLPEND